MSSFVSYDRRRSQLLATGQSTVYAARDDADMLKGIPKPTSNYQVQTSGNQSGTTAVYVPCFAQNDLVFTAAAKTVTSVTGGLNVVQNNDVIRFRGSALNDTEYTVAAAGGGNANTITLTTAPVGEISAVYITIAKQALQSNNCVSDLNTGLMWLRYGSYSPVKLGAASDGKLLWTATAVSVHAANTDIYIVAGGKGLATVIIKGGAGEILKYWPGYSYSFGFAGAIAKLPGFRCTAVATSGVALADLSITLNTGNLTCVTEGSDAAPVNGAINLSCNGIFGFANACIAAGVGGYTDWRVPNIFELAGLAGVGTAKMVPDTTAFASFPTADLSYIWSSSTNPNFATSGSVFFVRAADSSPMSGGVAKTAAWHVMLVRGGV